MSIWRFDKFSASNGTPLKIEVNDIYKISSIKSIADGHHRCQPAFQASFIIIFMPQFSLLSYIRVYSDGKSIDIYETAKLWYTSWMPLTFFFCFPAHARSMRKMATCWWFSREIYYLPYYAMYKPHDYCRQKAASYLKRPRAPPCALLAAGIAGFFLATIFFALWFPVINSFLYAARMPAEKISRQFETEDARDSEAIDYRCFRKRRAIAASADTASLDDAPANSHLEAQR